MNVNPFTRVDYLLTVGLVLVNVALKIGYAGVYPMAIDETFCFYHAQFGPAHIIEFLRNDQNVPLHDLLLHAWMKWAGLDVFRVRLFPLTWYALSTGLLYLIGQRFLSREVGLIATLLFIGSNMHVHYAQEVRAYAPFLTFTLLAIYQFFSLLANPPERGTLAFTWRWSAMTLTYVLLTYTHHFSAFVIGIQAISPWLFGGLKPLRRGMIAAVSITVLSFTPLAYFVARRFYYVALLGQWWLKPPTTPTPILEVFDKFANSWVGASLLIGLLSGAYLFRLGQRQALTIYEKSLLLFFPGAFVAMLLISYAMPIFLDRYLIYTTPAFHLLSAQACVRVFAQVPVRRLAYVGLLVLMASTYHPVFDRQWSMPAVTSHVRASQGPESTVYLFPRWYDMGFAYYYDSTAFRRGPDIAELQAHLARKRIYSVWELTRIDSLRFQQAPHLILIDNAEASPVIATAQRLRGAAPTRVTPFGILCVYEFGTRAPTQLLAGKIHQETPVR